LYRGWPRTSDELQAAFTIYNQQKAEIYRLIHNCDLLQPKHKKDMIDYLEDFYKTINNKREVQRVFVENLSRS
jgi:tryptophanyl-tRNA synthetase